MHITSNPYPGISGLNHARVADVGTGLPLFGSSPLFGTLKDTVSGSSSIAGPTVDQGSRCPVTLTCDLRFLLALRPSLLSVFLLRESSIWPTVCGCTLVNKNSAEVER